MTTAEKRRPLRRTACALALAGLALAAAAGAAPPERETLFQTSTINALMDGVYDGDLEMAHLLRQGDFGLGTLNALDGELVVLDGAAYQVKVDGRAVPVPGAEKTPFAAVTFFDADQRVKVEGTVDAAGLGAQLDRALPSLNLFYALRIDGAFGYIKARSVPRQRPPYPPLAEAARQQAVFEFDDVRGTLVGLRTPDYMQAVNVPGYHWHFVTADRTEGGHVLECRLAEVTAQVDATPGFHMRLPESAAFYRADLGRDRRAELEKVEK